MMRRQANISVKWIHSCSIFSLLSSSFAISDLLHDIESFGDHRPSYGCLSIRSALLIVPVLHTSCRCVDCDDFYFVLFCVCARRCVCTAATYPNADAGAAETISLLSLSARCVFLSVRLIPPPLSLSLFLSVCWCPPPARRDTRPPRYPCYRIRGCGGPVVQR